MARHSSPLSTIADLSFDQLKLGVARLKRRLGELEDFNPDLITQENMQAITAPLQASIEDSVGQVLAHDSIEYQRYEPVARFDNAILFMDTGTPLDEVIRELRSRRAKALALLNQAIASLEDRLSEVGVQILHRLSEIPDVLSRKVFVVHGQDIGAREAVARFLERTGLEPITLHEQPNRGRTIIEKLEEHSTVGFAVILLTPDDMIRIAGEAMQPRTCQNFIFELGYFISHLGRDKVCALKSGDFESPSDIFGVVWTAFDTGSG